VRDRLVLRQFCRVYLSRVSDDTTLIRWVGLIRPDTLERFSQRLTQLATRLKVTQGHKLRTDDMVVETNIHSPRYSRLLADSVRVLGRTLSRARQALGPLAHLGRSVFRDRTRSVRRLACRVGDAMRRGGDTAQTIGQAAYQKLVQATQATLQQAEQVLPVLQAQATPAADKLVETLATFIPRAKQVVDQTIRRVFEQEKVPAGDKIVSTFEARPFSLLVRK
jgi:IS5 family transposase